MKVYVAYLPDIENRPDLLEKYQNLLSAEEKHRYQNMTDKIRQLQFLIGRALIQETCHQSPKLLPSGKPVVKSGYISLAHSGPYVILALDESPTGIDIEDTSKNKDFTRLAGRLKFRLTGDIRRSFYQQFTRYESTYKIAVSNRPLYHDYYSIDAFIVCVSSLNKNKKIEFTRTIPFTQNTPFIPTYLETEVQDDLS